MRKIFFLLLVSASWKVCISQEINSYTTNNDARLEIKARTPGIFMGTDPFIGNASVTLDRNRIDNRSMIEFDQSCPTTVNSPINMWTLGLDGDDILRLSRYRQFIGETSTDALLFSVDASTESFMTIPSHAKLRFGNEGNGSSIRGSSLEMVLGTLILTPSADNVTNLGGSTRRFKEVYTVNGVITSSDARLKRDIASQPYGLKQIMKLNPIEFTWKNMDDPTKQLGLIAQEVLSVIPEAVATTEIIQQDDGHSVEREADYYSIRYHFLIPVLISAIQDQQEELVRLKAEAYELLKD